MLLARSHALHACSSTRRMLTSKWERPAWTQKVRHRVQACKRPHRRQVGRPTRLASINQLNTADVCNLLPRVTSPQRDYSAMACVEMLRCRHMNAPSASMGHASLPARAPRAPEPLPCYPRSSAQHSVAFWCLLGNPYRIPSRHRTSELFPSSSRSTSAVGAVGCSSKPQVN